MKQERKKRETVTVRYIGQDQSAEVPGLGVFPHGEAVTFSDPEKVKQARHLLQKNVNFEEVGE